MVPDNYCRNAENGGCVLMMVKNEYRFEKLPDIRGLMAEDWHVEMKDIIL